jgi:hypothetical protein
MMGDENGFWEWVARISFLILVVDILTRWYDSGIYG